MASNDYIESTTSGLHWQIGVYKPQGRPAVINAIEGKLAFNADGSPRSFEYTMFEARSIVHQFIGTNTQSNRRRMIAIILHDLIEHGYINKDVRVSDCPNVI